MMRHDVSRSSGYAGRFSLLNGEYIVQFSLYAALTSIVASLQNITMENLVDKLNIPLCGDLPNASLLARLAELSALRLLNHVHHAMYAEGNEYLLQANYIAYASDSQDDGSIHRAMSSSLKVSMELDGN